MGGPVVAGSDELDDAGSVPGGQAPDLHHQELAHPFPPMALCHDEHRHLDDGVAVGEVGFDPEARSAHHGAVFVLRYQDPHPRLLQKLRKPRPDGIQARRSVAHGPGQLASQGLDPLRVRSGRRARAHPGAGIFPVRHPGILLTSRKCSYSHGLCRKMSWMKPIRLLRGGAARAAPTRASKPAPTTGMSLSESEDINPYQITALVCAVRFRGESSEEIAKGLHFDSVEQMRLQLQNWELPDWIVGAESNSGKKRVDEKTTPPGSWPSQRTSACWQCYGAF